MRIYHFLSALPALLFICGLMHTAAFACSGNGPLTEISGTAEDPSGLLAGVEFTLTCGNNKWHAVSDKNGRFSIAVSDLTPDKVLLLRWSRPGFPPVTAYAGAIKPGEKLFVSMRYDHVPKDSAYLLRLPSNPSTGYSWFLPECPPQLKYLGSRTEALPADAPCGRGTYEEWSFTASGSCTLVMQYKRPWEDKPVQRMHVSCISVR